MKGKQSVARAHVMAVQRDTGDLLPGFVADTNGIVHVVLSDGVSVYVGGEFTTVNGVAANHIAKLDAVTGAVDTGFHAGTTNFVSDLVIVGSKLYAVGEFGQMNGVSRQGAALLDKTTGALDPTFDPSTDGRVNTVAINPAGTKLYLAGIFQHIGSASRPWIVEVNPTTGAAQGPVFTTVQDYVRDVTVGPDGLVYARGGRQAEQRLRLRPDDGQAEVAPARQRRRAGRQVQQRLRLLRLPRRLHDQRRAQLHAADPGGQPADRRALNPGFMPESGAYPGVLTIDADGTYLAVGGYFGRMGGTSVNGLSIHP